MATDSEVHLPPNHHHPSSCSSCPPHTLPKIQGRIKWRSFASAHVALTDPLLPSSLTSSPPLPPLTLLSINSPLVPLLHVHHSCSLCLGNFALHFHLGLSPVFSATHSESDITNHCTQKDLLPLPHLPCSLIGLFYRFIFILWQCSDGVQGLPHPRQVLYF